MVGLFICWLVCLFIGWFVYLLAGMSVCLGLYVKVLQEVNETWTVNFFLLSCSFSSTFFLFLFHLFFFLFSPSFPFLHLYLLFIFYFLLLLVLLFVFPVLFVPFLLFLHFLFDVFFLLFSPSSSFPSFLFLFPLFFYYLFFYFLLLLLLIFFFPLLFFFTCYIFCFCCSCIPPVFFSFFLPLLFFSSFSFYFFLLLYLKISPTHTLWKFLYNNRPFFFFTTECSWKKWTNMRSNPPAAGPHTFLLPFLCTSGSKCKIMYLNVWSEFVGSSGTILVDVLFKARGYHCTASPQHKAPEFDPCIDQGCLSVWSCFL